MYPNIWDSLYKYICICIYCVCRNIAWLQDSLKHRVVHIPKEVIQEGEAGLNRCPWVWECAICEVIAQFRGKNKRLCKTVSVHKCSNKLNQNVYVYGIPILLYLVEDIDSWNINLDKGEVYVSNNKLMNWIVKVWNIWDHEKLLKCKNKGWKNDIVLWRRGESIKWKKSKIKIWNNSYSLQNKVKKENG